MSPSVPDLSLVEDEVLSEETHRLRGALVELGGCGDGMPVAAHQFAHGRASADLGESFVLLLREHSMPPALRGFR